MTFERIAVNPKILGGKPCIRGTRIPVTMILELLEDGLSFEEIIRNYYPQLQREDIQACLEYAKVVVDGEEVHFIQDITAG
jgi:uncharacterized protein (DUF433 family)